jgi:hypothetical protein
LVYTFFSFFLGQSGLYARKHLEAEWQRLFDNQRILENTNLDIQRTKENIMYDQDTVSVYARQLGYGRVEDEKFIRIKGLSVAVTSDMPVGHVLYAAAPDFISDKTIKIISLCFGLTVLVYFLIRDFYFFKDIFSSGYSP